MESTDRTQKKAAVADDAEQTSASRDCNSDDALKSVAEAQLRLLRIWARAAVEHIRSMD